MSRHQQDPDHLFRYKRLIEHLPTSGSPNDPAVRLRQRLSNCGDPNRWRGNRFDCRSPACPSCRDVYISREWRRLEERYWDTTNDELAMLSVIVGVTRQVDGIGPIWRKARKRIRNIVDKYRRRSPAWNAVQIDVWLEIDVVEANDIARLGNEKQRQISELGSVKADETNPVWIVGFHGIVSLGPRVSAGEVEAAFSSTWKRFRQVDVRSFFGTCSPADNIRHVVNYGLKHQCETTFGDGLKFPWDEKRVVEYYMWISVFSYAFKSLKTRVGRKKGMNAVVTRDLLDMKSSDNHVL